MIDQQTLETMFAQAKAIGEFIEQTSPLIEGLNDILTTPPKDHEEARRIAWLKERLARRS